MPAEEDEPVKEALPTTSDPTAENAAPTVTADDSPTVVDHPPPAVTIVTDGTGEVPVVPDTGYRGLRRRNSGWRRYPVGAVAVAVLIMLITAVVAVRVFSGTGRADHVSDERAPAGVPGMPPLGAASPESSRSASSSVSASPSPSASVSRSAKPSPSDTGSGSPSPSRTPSVIAGPLFRIVGTSGKCIETRSSGSVVLDDCDGGDNQRWSLPGDGTIRSQGQCLDVQNNATGDGSPVQMRDCNGSAGQFWRGRGDGTLQHQRSGRCLDAENGNSDDGTRLIIWSCHGGSNQRWRVG